MLTSAFRQQQLITRCTVQHFNASDGLRLAYTIDDFTDPWLKSPTLLLLHAAMGHSRRYYAWVPRLCRHYRVVRMDLRGHGEFRRAAGGAARSQWSGWCRTPPNCSIISAWRVRTSSAIRPAAISASSSP